MSDEKQTDMYGGTAPPTRPVRVEGTVRFQDAYDEMLWRFNWLREYFYKMRYDKRHALDLGDIRITIGQQHEIIEMFNPENISKVLDCYHETHRL